MDKKDAEKVTEHETNLASLAEAIITNSKPVKALFNAKATQEEKSQVKKLNNIIMDDTLSAFAADDYAKKIESTRRVTNALISRAEILASVVLREDPASEASLTDIFKKALGTPKFKSDKYADTLQSIGAKTLERVIRNASK